MIENRLRLERQIYLGRQIAKSAQQSSRGSNVPLPPLPPAFVGQQINTGRAMTFLAEDSDDDDFDTRTLDAPEGWAAPMQQVDVPPSSSKHTSFLSRLRTQSFPGLTSPVRNMSRLSRREERVERHPETSSSSDSSAEEELQRPVYHPGVQRSRPDVRQIFQGDGTDGDQEDEGL
jgi:hypothetical protein